MEESEKRRERLRAMRDEAASNQQQSPATPLLGASPLSNPLDHQHQQLQQSSEKRQTTRFEYYTDPLAAFTGSHKKKAPRPPPGSLSPSQGSKIPHPGSRPHYQGSPSTYFTPSPPLPADIAPRPLVASLSPSQGSTISRPGLRPSYQGSPSTYFTPSPLAAESQPPVPIWQPNFYPPSNSSSTYSTPSPCYTPGQGFGSPQAASRHHFYNYPTNNHSNPIPGYLPSTSPSHEFTSNTGQNDFCESKTKNFGSSPGGRGSSPGGRGSPWSSFNRSPGGRGSPRGNRDGRILGRSGSKQYHRTSRNEHVSARDHPELFFKKSMVEDPWKGLVPVMLDSKAFGMEKQEIGAECSDLGTNQSWLPKSISTKKLKVSESRVNMTPSGPSLAETLAASLADVVSGDNEQNWHQ